MTYIVPGDDDDLDAADVAAVRSQAPTLSTTDTATIDPSLSSVGGFGTAWWKISNPIAGNTIAALPDISILSAGGTDTGIQATISFEGATLYQAQQATENGVTTVSLVPIAESTSQQDTVLAAEYPGLTANDQWEKLVIPAGNSGSGWLNEFYLSVTGESAFLKESLGTAGITLPDEGRFLVTTGQITGARDAAWGDWQDTVDLGGTETTSTGDTGTGSTGGAGSTSTGETGTSSTGDSGTGSSGGSDTTGPDIGGEQTEKQKIDTIADATVAGEAKFISALAEATPGSPAEIEALTQTAEAYGQALGTTLAVTTILNDLNTELAESKTSEDTWTAVFSASLDLLGAGVKATIAEVAAGEASTMALGVLAFTTESAATAGIAVAAAPFVVPAAGIAAVVGATIALDYWWDTQTKPSYMQLYKAKVFPPTPSHTVVGVDIDGPIAGATVFIDSNLNGIQDPGEPSTTTASDGSYTLAEGYGPIIIHGGTDTTTGLPFTGTIVTDDGNSVATPLTTLISDLASHGDVNVDELIANVFSLDLGTDFETFNPVAQLNAGNASAPFVYVAGAEVAVTEEILSALFSGSASASVVGYAASGIIEALIDRQPFTPNTSTATGARLGLDTVGTADGSSLGTSTLIDIMGQALGHPVSSQEAANVASELASFNQSMEASVAAGLTPSALITAVAKVEQNAAAFSATLQSSALTHVLTGTAGVDTATFSGGLRDYVITSTSAGPSEVTDQVNGRDGVTTLTNYEDLKFIDGRLTFDPNDPAFQVERLYQATLGRTSDALGLVNWVDVLSQPGETLEQIVPGFLNSAEFQSTYGNTSNADFVKLLYNNVLGRAPDPEGQANWLNDLAGGASRPDVVLGFSESNEFKTIVAGENPDGLFVQNDQAASVARLYYATLDRAPDEAGLVNWTNLLSKGTPLDAVAAAFTNSAEFQTKYGALDNTHFVDLLYHNVLGRAADAAGEANWVGNLAAGASRADVVLGFSESQEFKATTEPRLQNGFVFA